MTRDKMAVEFRSRYNDAATLMAALDAAGIRSDQDWSNETTYWSFEDGSEIAISGPSVKVIDRGRLASEVGDRAPEEARDDHEEIAEAIRAGESWGNILSSGVLGRWPMTYAWLKGEVHP